MEFLEDGGGGLVGGRFSEHAYCDSGHPNRMEKDGSVVKVS